MQISRTLRALANGMFGYYCPGCQALHTTAHGITLTNFNVTKPTFSDSIKIGRGRDSTCHHTITDGKIAFGADSRHKLRGKTVDLPDLPEEYQDTPRRG